MWSAKKKIFFSSGFFQDHPFLKLIRPDLGINTAFKDHFPLMCSSRSRNRNKQEAATAPSRETVS